jgi:hypothetical protein
MILILLAVAVESPAKALTESPYYAILRRLLGLWRRT